MILQNCLKCIHNEEKFIIVRWRNTQHDKQTIQRQLSDWQFHCAYSSNDKLFVRTHAHKRAREYALVVTVPIHLTELSFSFDMLSRIARTLSFVLFIFFAGNFIFFSHFLVPFHISLSFGRHVCVRWWYFWIRKESFVPWLRLETLFHRRCLDR